MESPFTEAHFRRFDETPDAQFYREPRLVTHIDDAAIAALSAFYASILPPGGHILDLMSSWVSHLPEPVPYSAVTGLGMNDVELARNSQLSKWVVQDLNENPALPFEDAEFDGGVVTVSIQYLTRPQEVFADLARVLKPGAPFVVTYSNRCFPTKAVAVWQALGDREHADLIAAYFRLAGGFSPARAYDLSPAPGQSDPLFAVVARRLGTQ